MTKLSGSLKIAFVPAGGESWLGGVELVRNQLYAVKHSDRENVRICLLETPGSYDISETADVRIRLSYPRRHSLSWFYRIGMNYASHHLLNSDHFIASALRKNGISVIVGVGLTSRFDGIPSLTWISDFQHNHFPQFFTAEEIRTTNESYRRMIRGSSRILLYSQSVKSDFHKFAPDYEDKVRVLNPVAVIPNSVYEMDPRLLVARYNLPTKFFYFPNNFAIHKNHQAVFEAVQKLRGEGVDVKVVCTGAEDHRRPSSFATIWRGVSELGIRDNMIYLGLLPHDHLLTLMRQCICVLSMSLFEGWGLTVAEAHSLGKKALISDIAPFREQSPPQVTFVDPTKPDQIADRMAEIWDHTPAGPDAPMETDARSNLPKRLKDNAEQFMGIVDEVVR